MRLFHMAWSNLDFTHSDFFLFFFISRQTKYYTDRVTSHNYLWQSQYGQQRLGTPAMSLNRALPRGLHTEMSRRQQNIK